MFHPLSVEFPKFENISYFSCFTWGEKTRGFFGGEMFDNNGPKVLGSATKIEEKGNTTKLALGA